VTNQRIQIFSERFWQELASLLPEKKPFREVKNLINNSLDSGQVPLSELIIETGDLGIWEIDFEKKTAYRNKQWLQMLGYPQGELNLDYELWTKLIHPDDKAKVESLVKRVVKGEIPKFEIEYRLKCADGTYKWVLDRGKVVKWNEKGEGIKLAGVQSNISLVKESQSEAERLYVIIEQTPDFIGYSNENGLVLYGNQALRDFLGYDPANTNLEELVFKIFSVESANFLQQIALPAAVKNGRWEGEVTIVNSKGEPLPFYQTILVHKNENDSIQYISTLVRNISLQKQAIQALEESERKFRTFAETAQATIILHKGSKIQYCNPSFTELTGYSIAEAMEMDLWEFIHPDDKEMVRAFGMERLKKGNENLPQRYEYRVITKEGSYKWIDFSVSAIKIQGEFLVMGIAFDITKRKEYEVKLLESEEKFRSFAELLPEVVIEADLEGNILFVNRFALKIFGFQPDEKHLVKNIFQFLDNQDIDKVQRDIQRLVETNRANQVEYTAIRKDGSKFPVLGSSTLVFEDGKVVGIRAILVDISHQKELEGQIKESEQNLTEILENSDEAYALFDAQYKLINFNSVFADFISSIQDREVTKGKNFFDLVKDESVLRWKELINKMVLGEKVNVKTKFDVKGNPIYLEVSLLPIMANGRLLRFVFNSKNITERVEYENFLISQEKLLEGLNDAAFNLLIEQDFNIAVMNFLSQVGESFNADRAYIFKNSLNADGQICMNQVFEWTASGVRAVIDMTELMELPYFEAGLSRVYKVLSRQESFSGIVKNLEETERVILESQEILSIIICPIFIKGIFWGFIGLDDCTREREFTQVEIKLMFNLANALGGAIDRENLYQEMKKARERAEEASVEKANFLSTMSHEIRTPMNSVIGMTHLLLQDNPRPDQIENLNLLKFSSQNLLALINDILDFSKIEAGKVNILHEEFDLEELVSSICKSLEPLAREKSIKLFYLISEQAKGFFFGDPFRINQILTNLISNAVKFTYEGEIFVSVKATGKLGSKKRIKISIKDTGIGIPKDRLDYIFESFTQIDSSQRRRQGGTGLGLAITRKLLNLMGSDIQVVSEVGEGSEFSFELFLEKSDVLGNLDNSIQYQPDKGASLDGIHCLLIEDNKVNQVVASKFLNGWGISTDIADNGELGLRKLNENEYQLVLMDLQMPVMDGFTATREIRANKNPKIAGIPIIALTAAVLSDEERKARIAGVDEFIAKPFNPNDLLRKIIKVLNKKSSMLPNRKVPLDLESGLALSAKGLKPNFSTIDDYAKVDIEFSKKVLSTILELLEEASIEYINALENLDYKRIRAIKHKIKPELVQLDVLILDIIMEEGKQIALHKERSMIHINISRFVNSLNKVKAIIEDKLLKI
jgi:PAS domain S-box-containing protein